MSTGAKEAPVEAKRKRFSVERGPMTVTWHPLETSPDAKVRTYRPIPPSVVATTSATEAGALGSVISEHDPAGERSTLRATLMKESLKHPKIWRDPWKGAYPLLLSYGAAAVVVVWVFSRGRTWTLAVTVRSTYEKWANAAGLIVFDIMAIAVLGTLILRAGRMVRRRVRDHRPR
jgi:hypothetical protein